MARKPKRLHEMMELLREHTPELRKRFSVARIGLFGSVVRDEATPESDVDVLVEFAEPTFDNYMGLKFHLEELFGVEVDLVLADSLKPRLKPYIEGEVVYA